MAAWGSSPARRIDTFRGETLLHFVSRGEGSSTPGHASCYETGISSGRMGPFAHVRFAPFFVLTS